MRAKFFMAVIAIGLIAGPTELVAQDTIFISMGEYLIHPDTPVPDALPTNTPGQIVGSANGTLSGTFWNVVNQGVDLEDDAEGNVIDPDPALEEPFLNWSDGTSVGPTVQLDSAVGRGGGSATSNDANAGVINFFDTIGLNGRYDAEPGDASQLSGILTGPAGSVGHTWQKSIGVRVLDLPAGTYEVFATGVPYSKYNGFGAGVGWDLDVYIGTTDPTPDLSQIPLPSPDRFDLEDELAAGKLAKTRLTHDNYETWELGDNYALETVTLTAGDALTIAADLSLITPFPNILPSLGTIEIRRLTTTSLAGDFDDDQDVDGADFLRWQRGESPNAGSAADLADWEAGYGTAAGLPVASSVPEPSSGAILLTAISAAAFRRRRRAA